MASVTVGNSAVSMGLCVPASCNGEDLKEALQLFQTPNITLPINLSSVTFTCVPKERPSIGTAGIIVIIVACLLAFMVIVGLYFSSIVALLFNDIRNIN